MQIRSFSFFPKLAFNQWMSQNELKDIKILKDLKMQSCLRHGNAMYVMVIVWKLMLFRAAKEKTSGGGNCPNSILLPHIRAETYLSVPTAIMFSNFSLFLFHTKHHSQCTPLTCLLICIGQAGGRTQWCSRSGACSFGWRKKIWPGFHRPYRKLQSWKYQTLSSFQSNTFFISAIFLNG